MKDLYLRGILAFNDEIQKIKSETADHIGRINAKIEQYREEVYSSRISYSPLSFIHSFSLFLRPLFQPP